MSLKCIMPKPFPHLLLITLMLFILPSVAVAQDSGSLKRFLQGYVKMRAGRVVDYTTYLEAWINLNGDGNEEAIVYLTGGGWCGSGGCSTLILQPEGSSYRIITELPYVNLPIRVLNTSSNGWRNLTVWVRSGGVGTRYETELRFNGKTYPTDPLVPPAKPLRKKAEGNVLISDNGPEKWLFR